MPRTPSEVLEDEEYLISDDEAAHISKQEEQEEIYEKASESGYDDSNLVEPSAEAPASPGQLEMFEEELEDAILGHLKPD